MGRKKRLITKSNSPSRKKTKSSTGLTIDNLFKRVEESSGDSDSAAAIITLDQQNDKDYDINTNIQINSCNICGETDLNSIIELIDEWVNTEEELMDEDVAYISKFFIDLSTEKDKEKIKEIVDHFYDSVSKRENDVEEWRTMYNDTIGLIVSEFEELNFDFF